jgi:hypothetical protein
MIKQRHTLPLTHHIQCRPVHPSCYNLHGPLTNKLPIAYIIRKQQTAQLEKCYLFVVYTGVHRYITIITAITCYCYGSYTNAQQDEPHQGNFCYSGMHSPVCAQLLLFIQLETERFTFIHTTLNISSVHSLNDAASCNVGVLLSKCRYNFNCQKPIPVMSSNRVTPLWSAEFMYECILVS